MNLRKLPENNELLEIALRRGRKEAGSVEKQATPVKKEKAREKKRIEVTANYVERALSKVVTDFPNIEEMNPFYRELVKATIDADRVKQALGQFSSVSKIVRKLKRTHLIRVNKIGRTGRGKAKAETARFIGRLSSVVKSLGKSIKDYNKAAVKLKELPKIKTNLPTAIIAGCPNAGKSTLLGKLTGSNVKIASYPFTTQKLEMGYFKQRYQDFQLIDTPGLLDRPLEKRNRVERKGIAALKHLALLIIFVLDPSEHCGFSQEAQASLLKGIAKEFGKGKVAVYLSKRDIASAEQAEKAVKRIKGFALIEGSLEEIRKEISGRCRI